MKLIVGLGNPGKDYAGTRHNIGFEVVAMLAEKNGMSATREKFKAVYAEGFIGTQKVMIVQPLTYMNCSGDAVREFMNFYKLSNEDLIVCCDDINLPVGALRIREKGSDGGQKGLRSIMYQLGYDNFVRVRVGVGDKPEGRDLKNHVLSKFRGDEKDAILSAVRDAVDAVEMTVKENSAISAMNKYNKKGQGKQDK